MFGSFKRFIKAWALVLAWQMPRSQHKHNPIPSPMAQERETKKQKKRRLKKERQKHFERPPRRAQSHARYLDSKSKNKRFSNQRMLRRMFRNM